MSKCLIHKESFSKKRYFEYIPIMRKFRIWENSADLVQEKVHRRETGRIMTDQKTPYASLKGCFCSL